MVLLIVRRWFCQIERHADKEPRLKGRLNGSQARSPDSAHSKVVMTESEKAKKSYRERPKKMRGGGGGF